MMRDKGMPSLLFVKVLRILSSYERSEIHIHSKKLYNLVGNIGGNVPISLLTYLNIMGRKHGIYHQSSLVAGVKT